MTTKRIPKGSRVKSRQMPDSKPKGGFTGKKKDAGRESLRGGRAFQTGAPLQRVKRAPGEVNPRKGKRGGLNRSGKMIE